MKDNFSQESGQSAISVFPHYDFVTIALSFPGFSSSHSEVDSAEVDESQLYSQENICLAAEPAAFDGYKFVLVNKEGEKFMLTLEPKTRRAEDVLQEEQALALLKEESDLLLLPEKAVTGKPYLFRHNRLWTMRKFVEADKQFNWRLPTWNIEHCHVGGALLAQLHATNLGVLSKEETRLLRPPAQWKDVCLARLEQLFALAGEFELDNNLNFSVDSAQIITGRVTEKLCEIKEIELMVEQWFKKNASVRSWHTVIHGDFHPGNLLFANRKIQKIIDWDYARLDDPLFDFAYARMMFAGNFRACDFSCAELFDLEKVQAFDAAYRAKLSQCAESLVQTGINQPEHEQEHEHEHEHTNVKVASGRDQGLWLAVLLSMCPESESKLNQEVMVKDLLFAYYDLVLALILTFEIEQALYFKAQADLAAKNRVVEYEYGYDEDAIVATGDDGVEAEAGKELKYHSQSHSHSQEQHELQDQLSLNISANKRILENILAYFRRS